MFPLYAQYILMFGWFFALCCVTHYLSNRPPRYEKPYVDKNYITEELW